MSLEAKDEDQKADESDKNETPELILGREAPLYNSQTRSSPGHSCHLEKFEYHR